MVMKQPFTTISPVIATFDAIDLADGSGIVLFNGANTKNSGNLKHLMTRDVVFSNDIETQVSPAVTTGALTKVLEADFDILLNIPKTMLGNARFNATIRMSGIAGSGNVNAYVVFKLRKWDGSTETEIVNVQTETIDEPTIFKEFLADVDVPNTHFAAGETIRVTVEVWGFRAGTPSSVDVSLAHDPVARNSTLFPSDPEYTTQLKFYLPFEQE